MFWADTSCLGTWTLGVLGLDLVVGLSASRARSTADSTAVVIYQILIRM